MAVLRKLSDADLSGYIRAQSMPVNADGPYDELARATDAFADARVILLGECSHGTSEFYQARAAITQRLVVESQQVVHGETESTDGCLMFNAAMGSMEVVSMCPACEAGGPLV